MEQFTAEDKKKLNEVHENMKFIKDALVGNSEFKRKGAFERLDALEDHKKKTLTRNAFIVGAAIGLNKALGVITNFFTG